MEQHELNEICKEKFKQLDLHMQESIPVRLDVEMLKQDIVYIKETLARIEKLITERYVTIQEFEPIRKIVYGVVGLILTTVLVGLIMLVIKQ